MGEDAAARRGHARYFLDRAAFLDVHIEPGESASLIRLLTPDRDNIRAIVEDALSVAPLDAGRIETALRGSIALHSLSCGAARAAGMRHVIARRAGGYLLSPHIRVTCAPQRP